jgi:ADP-ribose pyrophosphatase
MAGKVASAAELLFRGEHLNLMRRRGWEYAEHRTAIESVMIVALTAQKELLLVEEFRPSVDAPVISLPAGLSGDEFPEEPARAAQRELREETGYAARSLEPIGRGPGSAGASSEMVTFFFAPDARLAGEQAPADRGLLRVHLVALERLSEWTREQEARGALVDPKIWAGLYLAPVRETGRVSGSGDRTPRP